MKKESPLMYSFSTNAIHLGILKWKESLLICIRFQLGNSFWNSKMERKSTYVFVFS